MSVSTYAFMTEETVVRRDGRNKISILTHNPLTDDQMKDLYWVVLAMEKTGARLKDMFENKKEE